MTDCAFAQYVEFSLEDPPQDVGVVMRDDVLHLFRKASGDAEVLYFEGFQRLVEEVGVPVGDEGVEGLYKRVEMYGEGEGVGVEDFWRWVEEGGEEAEMIKSHVDPSVYAGMARALTTMTRPLAQSLGAVMNLAATKIGLLISKYIANPVRLFKRAAVGTLEVVGRKRGSLTMAAAVRAEFASGGMYSLFRLALGPYLFNSIVSLTMFETYSRVKSKMQNDVFYSTSTPYTQIFKIEGTAAASAGAVQAVLNTPVYNVKRRFPGMIITDGLLELYIQQGSRGLFADLPLMAIQEICGLVAFFASYEIYKQYLAARVEEQYKVATWVLAGMAAGMTLTCVTHPFDNLHEWHIVHRRKNHPQNALLHFLQHGKNKRKILTHGLLRRLPLGIPAGIPLLVYEVMIGNEGVQGHVEQHLSVAKTA